LSNLTFIVVNADRFRFPGAQFQACQSDGCAFSSSLRPDKPPLEFVAGVENCRKAAPLEAIWTEVVAFY